MCIRDRIPSDDGSEQSWDEWRMTSSIKKVYRFWKLREKKLMPFNEATSEYIVRHARNGIEGSPAKFYDFYCGEVFDGGYDSDTNSCPVAQETCEDGLENAFDFHRAFEEDFMEYWNTLRAMLPSTICGKEIIHDSHFVSQSEPGARLHACMGRLCGVCLLYTSPSPRDATLSRMPSSA